MTKKSTKKTLSQLIAHRKWSQRNRDHCLEWQRNYRLTHQGETQQEKRRAYYEENAEKLKEKSRIYYHNNKGKRQEYLHNNKEKLKAKRQEYLHRKKREKAQETENQQGGKKS